MKHGEVRHLTFEEADLRMVTDGEGKSSRTLVGKAVVYGSVSVVINSPKYGKFRERFAPGAFAEALKKGADVRCLICHQSQLILGREKSGTLRIFDRPDCLAFEDDIPNTSYGNDLIESMGRRDIDGMSFHFMNPLDRWEPGEDGIPLRTVIAADIDEITVTPFPAYPDSEANLRSIEGAERSLCAYLETVRQAPDGKPLNRELRRLRLEESV